MRVVFRSPDAVAATLAAQRALAAQDFSGVDGLRVRAAIHTGTAEERDGDYFGGAVNRVARLLANRTRWSGARPPQQPPTSCTANCRRRRACAIWDSIVSKNLSRPEQVYQLVAPDLPEAFPPLRSLDALPNNLPRQLTSFVGREVVLSEVAALIEKSPLVTLVGPGGAGKTRCAVQVGAELLERWDDGVWLVELAKIVDPSLVASICVQALNVEEAPNRSALETLLPYLKRKKLLLILEQLRARHR